MDNFSYSDLIRLFPDPEVQESSFGATASVDLSQINLTRSSPSSNTTDSFIAYWDCIPEDVCISIVKTYKISPKRFGITNKPSIDFTDKQSIEIGFNVATAPENVQVALQYLMACLESYRSLYFYSSTSAPLQIAEGFNFQHYPPTWAFHSNHSERNSIQSSSRFLVWMIYLNDVHDSGETEFFYQNLCIKPKTGRIVIWPTDWTHTHRGIPSPTEDKYILTGWFSFAQE